MLQGLQKHDIWCKSSEKSQKIMLGEKDVHSTP